MELKNIPSNHLRLGNFVALPVIASTACITAIEKDGVRIDLDNIDLDPGDDYFEIGEVYGVRITEDVLMRCGFTQVKNSKDWRKGRVFLHWRSQRQAYMIRANMPPMEHLHQLQNYYHAVVGEDLIYNRDMVMMRKISIMDIFSVRK